MSTDELATVEVAASLIAPAFTYVPLFAAKRRGFFERNQLECAYDMVGSGDAVTEALIRGTIQFAPNTPEGVLADRATGGNLVIIAGLTNRLPFRLIGLPQHKTRDALRGGVIGVSSMNEGTVHVIKAMLSAVGLSYPEDYRLEVVGTHPKRWELLQKGEIDAGLQLTPYDHIAVNAGYSDLGDPSEFFPDFTFGVIAADSTWAAENHDVTVRILASLLEATEWVHSDRAGAADVLAEETATSHDLALLSVNSMIDDGVLPRDLRVSADGVRAVLNIMQANGTLPAGASLDPAWYVDESYLEEARRIQKGTVK
ncbi:ABC transporter substrate-binding protein [Subtercola sp. YIM 133946]|uniref:ABC transporter substrate-binding protein n=1 Tax=Subtercola sp. YIM 133946 TaxID=3118909 RepID=UPI002F923A24